MQRLLSLKVKKISALSPKFVSCVQ